MRLRSWDRDSELDLYGFIPRRDDWWHRLVFLWDEEPFREELALVPDGISHRSGGESYRPSAIRDDLRALHMHRHPDASFCTSCECCVCQGDHSHDERGGGSDPG